MIHNFFFSLFLIGSAESLLQQAGTLSGCGSSASTAVAYLVVAPRLWSTGLVDVGHGLGCFLAHGIFLDQGLNPCLLHQQVVLCH